MSRRPDSWEDPPEDPPEVSPEDEAADCGDYMYEQRKDSELDDLAWGSPTNAPFNRGYNPADFKFDPFKYPEK